MEMHASLWKFYFLARLINEDVNYRLVDVFEEYE